jgi:hypothetical protein
MAQKLSVSELVEQLDGLVEAAGAAGRLPLLVGLAGGPGSGKTTAATALHKALAATHGPAHAAALPMDGFHLSRAQLDAMADAATAHKCVCPPCGRPPPLAPPPATTPHPPPAAAAAHTGHSTSPSLWQAAWRAVHVRPGRSLCLPQRAAGRERRAGVDEGRTIILHGHSLSLQLYMDFPYTREWGGSY